MTHAVSFLLALAGFVLLLLAAPRHQQDWLGRKRSMLVNRSLRLSGFVALTLALAASGIGLGWAYGSVAWFGWLSVAAALVVAANTNRTRVVGKARW